MLRSNLSLGLTYNLDKAAVDSLFRPIISSFLYCQTGIAKEFRILDAETYISSYDFKSSEIVPMEHIYLGLLDQINRSKDSLDISIGVFITFDKRQCANYCSNSGRYFSSIKVGGIDKVYYLLFTTDELFDFLYAKEINYVEKASTFVHNDILNVENYFTEAIVSIDENTFLNEHIKGYLNNHNVDKGLSFVSCSNNVGYPIYHREFSEILKLEIGSIVELEICNSSKFGRVVKYSLLEDEEIEGLIQFFDGVLQRRGFSAYINTDLNKVKTIFVPSNIAVNFEEYNYTRVTCLARHKKPVDKDQYEWVALRVNKNSKIIL